MENVRFRDVCGTNMPPRAPPNNPAPPSHGIHATHRLEPRGQLVHARHWQPRGTAPGELRLSPPTHRPRPLPAPPVELLAGESRSAGRQANCPRPHAWRLEMAVCCFVGPTNERIQAIEPPWRRNMSPVAAFLSFSTLLRPQLLRRRSRADESVELSAMSSLS